MGRGATASRPFAAGPVATGKLSRFQGKRPPTDAPTFRYNLGSTRCCPYLETRVRDSRRKLSELVPGDLAHLYLAPNFCTLSPTPTIFLLELNPHSRI